jgi:CheY-like chemotaxis protein
LKRARRCGNCRRGALDRQGGRLPIIAPTASAFDEDRLQAGASGMDDFVS